MLLQNMVPALVRPARLVFAKEAGIAPVKTRISFEAIRKVIEPIVAQFHHEKVILFGSHAYGESTKDSDVDLLVVMETGESPLHVGARICRIH